jgi:hypothetical protein
MNLTTARVVAPRRIAEAVRRAHELRYRGTAVVTQPASAIGDYIALAAVVNQELVNGIEIY